MYRLSSGNTVDRKNQGKRDRARPALVFSARYAACISAGIRFGVERKYNTPVR